MQWPKPASAAARCACLVLSGGVFMLHASSLAASLLVAGIPMQSLEAGEHSVPLALNAAHGQALLQIASGQPGVLPGDQARYRSAVLVLDDVRLTAAGARGGYFYQVYLSVPGDALSAASQLVGTLGPFEVAAARQRGDSSLRYALSEPLAALQAQALSSLTVSFRRAGGGGAPDGPLVSIGSLRLELRTEDID